MNINFLVADVTFAPKYNYWPSHYSFNLIKIQLDKRLSSLCFNINYDIFEAMIMIKSIANKISLFAIFAFMIILMVPMDFVMAGGSVGKSSENSENTESDQKWNYCKVVYCETCNDHRCQTKTCPSKVDDCRSSGICLTTSFITVGLGISINLIVRRLQTRQKVD